MRQSPSFSDVARHADRTRYRRGTAIPVTRPIHPTGQIGTYRSLHQPPLRCRLARSAGQVRDDPGMDEDDKMSVVVALEDLPLLLPERIGELQIVLLRQSSADEEEWQLDYAAVGRTRAGQVHIEARDERGTEYFSGRSWSSADDGLLVGAQTFTPPLDEGIMSLHLILAREQHPSGTAEEQWDHPAVIAAGAVKRLQSQLAAWTQRDAVAQAVLVAATRAEAVRRLGAAPLGFNEEEAGAILDMPLRCLTQDGQAELEEYLTAARSHIESA